jgi:hypothetical protein
MTLPEMIRMSTFGENPPRLAEVATLRFVDRDGKIQEVRVSPLDWNYLVMLLKVAGV